MTRLSAISALVLAVTACASGTEATGTSSPPPTTTTPPTTTGTTSTLGTTTTAPAPTTTTTLPTTTTPPTTTLPPGVVPPPDWLGTRPLPLDEDGDPRPLPTPDIMVDRRFATEDVLPPPETDAFTSTISEVPPAVEARSTWEEGCPVDLDDLRYVTVSFWGFDRQPHTGELIVNAEVAEDLVGVFETLYEARFPIEAMEVTSRQDLDAEPTGDGNETAAFVCRPVTGSTGWSQHAYGLAVDINPFHNPYVRGDVVLPELAGAYTDRARVRPGMITEGDVVTEAFDDIGWGWGGRWRTLDDPQHFSRSGS